MEGWAERYSIIQRDIQTCTTQLKLYNERMRRERGGGRTGRGNDCARRLAVVMTVIDFDQWRDRSLLPYSLSTQTHTHAYKDKQQMHFLFYLSDSSSNYPFLSSTPPPLPSPPPIFNLHALILITQDDGEEPAQEKLKRKMESGEGEREEAENGVKGKEWKRNGGFVSSFIFRWDDKQSIHLSELEIECAWTRWEEWLLSWW